MRKSIAFCLLFVAALTPARFAAASAATITFAAPTIDIPYNPYSATDGYFDVTLTDSAAGDTLAQFQASMILDPGISNVSITGADLGQLTNPYNPNPEGTYPVGESPNLIDPYVFNGNSADVSSDNVGYNDPTDADQADLTNSGTVTLTANTVYSLEQVYYDVPANTPFGTYLLTFDTTPPGNSLQNDVGANFINLVSNTNTTSYAAPGTVIEGAIVVYLDPEPSSLCLMSLAIVGLFTLRAKLLRRTA
ncbi:MAG TPA: hypothetical protein VMF30_13925 [Pirellulales bacterium]|nr:hypothetical protein [Pirellulales bacterium]